MLVFIIIIRLSFVTAWSFVEMGAKNESRAGARLESSGYKIEGERGGTIDEQQQPVKQ